MSSADAETVIVLNPTSGSGDHADDVRTRAEIRGYALRETEGPGDAVRLAADAADHGASLVAAAGGDGTLNEVVHGVDRADALDRTAVGVIPVGTGNNFAGNVGIDGLDDAFAALDDGERRRIDLGTGDGRLFVNSCVGGITAEASGATTPEMKSRLGVLAYVVNTLESASSFDGLRTTVTIHGGGDSDDPGGDGGESVWSGEALAVLIGNGRRFSPRGSEQADMEDGLLDVTIVEEVPALDVVGEQLRERLLGRDSPHTRRFTAPALDLVVREESPVVFSFDGEMSEHRELSVGVRPSAVEVPVGERYEPHP